MKTALPLLFACSLLTWPTPALTAQTPPAASPTSTANESAAARVERLLHAVGGRAAWARAKFVHVQANHYELTLRDSFVNQIWNDFSAPRVRLAATIEGVDRVRALDGTRAWRLREGKAADLTAEQIATEHAWWESNLYRTFHRLAVNDPDLTAKCVGENRLEIFRRDGKRLSWLLLNPLGEPVRFATWDSEAASIFGPLVAEPSGVKHPKWGTSADASFRFEITGFHTAESVPKGVSFAAP